jgi:hypothetical protein
MHPLTSVLNNINNSLLYYNEMTALVKQESDMPIYQQHHYHPEAIWRTNPSITHNGKRGILKRKPKKNKILIPTSDMIRLFSLPQTTAAQKLNVSISTLKRRFTELDMDGKWPANTSLDEFHLGKPNAIAIKSQFHSTRSKKRACNFYSLYREPTAEQKLQVGTLLNERDTMDPRYIDPMTSTILNEAFKNGIEEEEEE